MFTGIISQFCPLIERQEKENFLTLTFDLGEALSKDINIGASVAINGTCLTVSDYNGTKASFDVMGETLSLTTIGQLDIGDVANIERAAKQGDEIGGHQLSGHIDGVADIISVEKPVNNYIVRFSVPNKALWPYLFNKGYVGIDGASLTLVDWDPHKGEFSVHLIPETLKRTVLGKKKQGDQVNLEIDRTTQAIVDTVTRVLNNMNLEKLKAVS